MKLIELIIKNFHWLIILNTAYGYWTRLEEHELAVSQIMEQKEPLETRIKQLNQKIEEAKIFTANLEVSKKRVEEVAKQIEVVQRQLPNTIDETEVLGFFDSEAQQLNFKPSMSPDIEEQRDFYIAKKFKIEAKGTYLQFLIFFERIASSERLINVQSVSIVPITEKQKGRFQMLTMNAVLESFKYNSQYKEDTGIDKIEAQFKEEAGPKRRKKKDKGGGE